MMYRFGTAVVTSFFLFLGITTEVTRAEPKLAAPMSVVEMALPAYQESSLQTDLPAKDIFFSSSNELWILGKRSLWTWNISLKKLRRIPIAGVKSKPPGFKSLGTDGVSLFAAADNNLFQIQLEPNKIYRYLNPFAEQGKTLGLAGEGEHFYWLHTTALMQIDRYGKAVLPRIGNTALKASDIVILDTKTMEMFFVRGRRLVKVELAKKTIKERTLLKAEHKLLDLQFENPEKPDAGHLLVHTAHTVLVIDRGGKVQQAIPVEGQRNLIAMRIRRDQHSYLFSDSLLESFDMRTKAGTRFVLPLENPDLVTKLQTYGNFAAIIEKGTPRLFSLAAAPR
jgi:hypothetical protein